ncbi:MAG: hypothetical protein K0R67_3949 [Paenibacillus sp.]|nr:hypothetical protein [Paenibacillus sp.]
MSCWVPPSNDCPTGWGAIGPCAPFIQCCDYGFPCGGYPGALRESRAALCNGVCKIFYWDTPIECCS